MPGRGETGPVGVLALQGSFSLHLGALVRLDARGRSVRKPADLEGIAGLILPGGESTAMSFLMEKYGLFQPIRDLARRGLPMMGTCAGAILLG
ncbi:MAG TPA: pyridoxal 5'-phosphate synthase glutaminase subunit PdxT, partial [Planctomycetota bacterium]|nr:pyridoxal 5'-phosphate synthase glutaminase subunit PdxT [Planctomycetota bacterium]